MSGATGGRTFAVCFTGGNVGLMGEIASTVYAGLGEENVIGVIPEALQPREVTSCCGLPIDVGVQHGMQLLSDDPAALRHQP